MENNQISTLPLGTRVTIRSTDGTLRERGTFAGSDPAFPWYVRVALDGGGVVLTRPDGIYPESAIVPRHAHD